MPNSISASTLEQFTTFGDLLQYLRRRVGITQIELSIAVGYSSSQISRLEQNLRLPDPPVIEARFVPALYLEDEPLAVSRLMELAVAVRREDAPAIGVCPYKGLDYYDEADAELFFGREELTERLVKRVFDLVSDHPTKQKRFLAIVGASGSGKSSIARAGLIPALRWSKPSANWGFLTITPTAHPLESLAAGLTRDQDSVAATVTLMDDLRSDNRALGLFIKRILTKTGGDQYLVVVDQFEECFNLCHSDEERSLFIDNLINATLPDNEVAIVVITLRADYYVHCASSPFLRQAIAENQEYIGSMSDEEMHRAIELPAKQGHWEIEPGLVDLLVRDVGQEPGALPLLSHALLETWQRRHGRLMTHSGYSSAGGVRGAIAETAEAVFADKLTQEQQIIAKRIFIRLTDLGDQTATADTRRRVKLSELILKPENAEDTEYVIKALVDARLVTIDEESVQVAHEALIREWPTLRGWLEQNRQDLRLHRQLTLASQEWQSNGYESDLLLRGTRLAQAQEWSISHADDMNTTERDFIAASQELAVKQAAERQAQDQRERETRQKIVDSEKQRQEEAVQSSRRLRRRTNIIAGVCILAIFLSAFGIYAWQHSSDQAALNRSIVMARYAQQAFQAGHSDLALALAMKAANGEHPPTEAISALRTVAQGPGTQVHFQNKARPVRTVAISNDNHLAVSGGCLQQETIEKCLEGELTLWDLVNQKELRRWSAHQGSIVAVAFNQDGQSFVSAGEDGSLLLWDFNGNLINQLADDSAGITSLAVVPNSSYLLSGSAEGRLILWELKTGEALMQFQPAASPITALAVAKNQLRAVSAHQDGSLVLWNLMAPEPIKTIPVMGSHINSVALTPNADLILFTTYTPQESYLKMIDSDTGEVVQQQSFESLVDRMVLSQDGITVLIACQDVFYEMDVVNWRLQHSFADSSTTITSISYSSDGQLGISGSEDGTIRLWELGQQLDYQLVSLNQKKLAAISIRWDGSTLLFSDALESGIEIPTLWDLSHNSLIRTYSGFSGVVSPASAKFSPDYLSVGVAGLAKEPGDRFGGIPAVMVWNIDSTKPRCRIDGLQTVGRALAFSPDSRYLVIGTQDSVEKTGQLVLWDVKTCQLVRQFDIKLEVTSVAYSMDGTQIVSGSGSDGQVVLWDVATGNELRRFLSFDHGPVLSITFGPGDATIIATGSADIFVWDTSTGAYLRSFTGLTSFPWSVAVSPEGRFVVAGGADGDLVLWDYSTGEEVRRLHIGSTIFDVQFTDDGKTVFAAAGDGRLIEWQIAEKSLAELMDWIKNNRYVRDLTCEERQQYQVEPQCNP